MQKKNINVFVFPIIALFTFLMLIFGAAYAYLSGVVSMNTANYQVVLPSQTSLVCVRTNCGVTVTPAMMTTTNTGSSAKTSNTCSVNCTCSGTPGSICSYNVVIRGVGLPYVPSSTLGTNKEFTVNVTSPSGCSVQNSSNLETQVNTQTNKIVSNCSLTVPNGGSTSANVTATFKWYNPNIDQDKHLNRLYNYKLVAGSEVPSSYQQVEYLILNGAPYIKTGFYFNPNTDGFSVTYKASTTNQNGMVIADTGGSVTTGSYIWVYHYNAGNKIGVWTKASSTYITGVDTEIHTTSYINKIVYMDDTKLATWTSTNFGTPNYEMLIGANYYNSNYNYFYKGNIYRVTFYRNNAIEMDLVPCVRKLDSVAGFYDVINGDFYDNDGGGTLTGGPNV